MKQSESDRHSLEPYYCEEESWRYSRSFAPATLQRAMGLVMTDQLRRQFSDDGAREMCIRENHGPFPKIRTRKLITGAYAAARGETFASIIYDC